MEHSLQCGSRREEAAALIGWHPPTSTFQDRWGRTERSSLSRTRCPTRESPQSPSRRVGGSSSSAPQHGLVALKQLIEVRQRASRPYLLRLVFGGFNNVVQ